MKRLDLLAYLFIPLLGCDGNRRAETPVRKPVDQTQTQSQPSLQLNFNYTYPRQILKGSGGEEVWNYSFYPIGFSLQGDFAYINRPCNGGCGCCTHDIVIQNLFSDKIERTYSIPSRGGGPERENHEKDWSMDIGSVRRVLQTKGISQTMSRLDRDRRFQSNDGLHNYNVSYNTEMVPNTDPYGYGPGMKYSIYVNLDGAKRKRISSGRFSDARGLEYIGYLKSPYTDQVALLFNRMTSGFEAEETNEVFVVGCHLDPASF